MPRHWSICFLVSPCYLQDVMPCQWSFSHLPRVLRNWESVFYPLAFFTFHSFLLVSRLPLRAGSLTSKIAGLKANLRNIAPARLFVWITTTMVVGSLSGLRLAAWWRIDLLRDSNPYHDRWDCQKRHVLSVRPQSHTVQLKLKF